MEFMGVLKRFLPFVFTFAAGLFVASFFVTVASPNFDFDTNRSARVYRECRRVKFEYRDLRSENQRLARENEILRMKLQVRDAEKEAVSSLPKASSTKTVRLQNESAY